jgi:putative ABC transport system substrate-binding protein
MRRREFITLLGGAAATPSLWPLAARAQQSRRVGVLMAAAASDPTGQSQAATFMQGLRKLGWIDGQNLQIQVRWAGAELALIQAYSADLVELFKPEVLLCATTANLAALQRVTSTIPIVFVQIADPVEQGLVPNLTHPGGNVTGFASNEFTVAGKWVYLLKQMAPSIARAAFLFNPETAPQSALYLRAAEAAGQSLGVQVMAAAAHSTVDVESALARLAPESNVGLIVATGTFLTQRAKLIVESAARYRLPAICGGSDEAFMAAGGLMQYSSDPLESYRLSPFYIDRILKGTKAGDLPVQLPTKFKFIVNRKTASALGIEVPLALLLAADEVIE